MPSGDKEHHFDSSLTSKDLHSDGPSDSRRVRNSIVMNDSSLSAENAKVADRVSLARARFRDLSILVTTYPVVSNLKNFLMNFQLQFTIYIKQIRTKNISTL